MKHRNTLTGALALTLGLTSLMSVTSVAEAQTRGGDGRDQGGFIRREQPRFELGVNRPKLVVLLHGVTAKPSEDPEIRVGQTGHARYYWGFEFIKALQGRIDESEMAVITPNIGKKLRAENAVNWQWEPDMAGSNPTELAPICFPITGWGKIPAGKEKDQAFLKDYIRLKTKTDGRPDVMVMVNTRDGSKHFMTQLAETIEEVYMSYTSAFGHLPQNQQPQLYLVTHSFGAIIARGILANPTGPDIAGRTLTPKQREMCDYLRERVVLVNTIAGPHEGDWIGDPAADVAAYLKTVNYASLMPALAVMDFFFSNSSKSLSKEELATEAKETLAGALDAVSGDRDCLQDLHRVPEYNAGILHPSTARRWRNGPMVPIYLAAGRNPGGHYYDQDRSVFYLGSSRWNPVDSIDVIKKGGRPGKEASGLRIVSSILHAYGYGREGGRPWGTATSPEGDRVQNPFMRWEGNASAARGLAAPWKPELAKLQLVANHFFEGKPYYEGYQDGQWDDDGFLGWDSAMAWNMQASNYYRIYERRKYGNWLPWDSDNHGSMMFNPGTGAWIHNELLREAGPIVAPGERRSVWGPLDFVETPSNSIKVELIEVKDPNTDLDEGSGADFEVSVRIGTDKLGEFVFGLPEGDVWTAGKEFEKWNIPSTVIPIKISIIEKDTPDPDDICQATTTPGSTTINLYYDTRTNRVMGDVNGLGGDILEFKPNLWWFANQVNTKIRISKISAPAP